MRPRGRDNIERGVEEKIEKKQKEQVKRNRRSR